MHVRRLLLLSGLNLILDSSAAPVERGLDQGDISNGISSQANNASIGSIPSDISYRVNLIPRNPVDTKQALGLMLATITDLAQRSLNEDLPDVTPFDVPQEYPRVHLQIGKEEGEIFPVRYAVWGLLKLLTELDRQRGNAFVAGALAVYKADGRGSHNAIGAIFLIPRQSNSDALNVVQAIDQSDGLTRRDELTARNNSSSTVPGGLATPLSDDLAVQFNYLSSRDIGQNKFFLTLFNAVFQLSEADTFFSTRLFRLDVPEYGTSFLIDPPNPPRRRPPINSRIDSIRVIGRLGAVCIDYDRFDEAQVTARLRNTLISTTAVRKL